MLTFIQKMARKNPEIVYGDGSEGTRDSPEARLFCRKVAANGMVLLKNEGNLLPLTAQKIKKLAVIGPNAKARIISGGGSAALKASYVITPWEGILQNAPSGIDIKYEVGCYGEHGREQSNDAGAKRCHTAHKYLPTLEENLVTPRGEPGWVFLPLSHLSIRSKFTHLQICTFYNHDAEGKLSEILGNFVLHDTRVKLNDFLPPGLTPTWTIKLRGSLTIDKTATFEFGLAVAGRLISSVNILLNLQ